MATVVSAQADAVVAFQIEHHKYHRISPERAREQTKVLRELEEFAGVPMLEVTADDFQRFLGSLIEVGRKPTTVGKIRSLVRPFIEWAWRKKLINAERYMELQSVAPPRGAFKQGRPRPYNQKQVGQLWSDLEKEYAPPYGVEYGYKMFNRWQANSSAWGKARPLAVYLQNRAIVGLALFGGIRLNEIYNLTLEQMDPANAYVVVPGAAKNREGESRDRAVPWATSAMREYVKEWLDLRHRIDPPHERPWLSLWGQSFYNTPLAYQRFEVILTHTGRGWEFHRCRHTAATEMLRAGYPLETVQKVLGHARIQQTLAYAELLPDDIVRVAARSEMHLAEALNPPTQED